MLSEGMVPGLKITHELWEGKCKDKNRDTQIKGCVEQE